MGYGPRAGQASGPACLGMAFPPFLVKQLHRCYSIVISSFVRTGYTTRRWGWLLGRIGYSITHHYPIYPFYTWTDYKTNAQIAKELKITPILYKLLEYERSWIQNVNRMRRNRLPRVMKHHSPTGRRHRGRLLKRLLDTLDRNGSTSGPTPWHIWWWWWWWYLTWKQLQQTVSNGKWLQEPAQSSPHPHIPLTEDPSKYYPPIYAWVSHVVSVSGFPTKTLHITLPHTRYMPRPFHSSRFYQPNNFGWGVDVIKLLIM